MGREFKANPQRAPRNNGRKGPAPKGHRNRKGGYGNEGGCCYAGAAVKAVWLGKFRLARRLARFDVKVRLGVL